ncbi:hypothetical protein K227x_59010 [Rubripirellula lacrimiformis]|uniref:Uncharacterized protein n=1 Tax=Rubripirellula lacrimiformis TaxID=1930273 RepID=A0A517NK10_9BACT|nr:hypothetical protein [Rubripirellula lacrimiformis]QDT07474.1 hypothetical protein K227x_59010 [Rubripirellula lacrimiformis]
MDNQPEDRPIDWNSLLDWDKAIDEAMQKGRFRWSRSAERSKSLEEVANSSVRSTLRQAKEMSVTEEEELRKLFEKTFKRHHDTATHAYRTGQGKSATFSALSTDEQDFGSQIDGSSSTDSTRPFPLWLTERLEALDDVHHQVALAMLKRLTVDETMEALTMKRSAVLKARAKIRKDLEDLLS